MERLLQIILIAGTSIFGLYIINMVRIRRLELKYTLLWILSGVSLFIIALFPGIVDFVSELLHIKEPVNTLFFIMGFFFIMIIFSLTKTISDASKSITALVQEIAILKFRLNEMKNEKKCDSDREIPKKEERGNDA